MNQDSRFLLSQGHYRLEGRQTGVQFLSKACTFTKYHKWKMVEYRNKIPLWFFIFFLCDQHQLNARIASVKTATMLLSVNPLSGYCYELCMNSLSVIILNYLFCKIIIIITLFWTFPIKIRSLNNSKNLYQVFHYRKNACRGTYQVDETQFKGILGPVQ